MKKILVALLIGVFALAASSLALTPGKLLLGVDTSAANLGTSNVPCLVVGYNFTDAISASLGLNYSSDETLFGFDNSQTGISARVNYFFLTLGDASPFVGLQYSIDGASTETSIISLLLGIEAEVANSVVLGAGIVPYSSATMSGNTDSSVSTGTGNLTYRTIFMKVGFYVN